MKCYIGLDVSSTNTGVCGIDEKGKFLFFFLITPPKKQNLEERFLYVKKKLFELLESLDIIGIGIETPSFYSRGRVIDLARGNGYIYYSLLEKGYNIKGFTPSQVTKFLLNGKKKKDIKVDNVPAGIKKKAYLWQGLPKEIKDELLSSSYKKYDDLIDAYSVANLVLKEVNAG